MTETTVATLVTEPTSAPADPPPSDDILFDPEDDLMPKPRPADERPARPGVTSLVVVRG